MGSPLQSPRGLFCAAAQRRRHRMHPPPMASVEKPKRRRDWSALDDLPLSIVAQRQDSLRDLLSLSSVCRSWCVAIEGAVMASQPPLFFELFFEYTLPLPPFFEDTLPLPLFSEYTRERFYHPGEKRFYKRKASIQEGSVVVGQSHGHLILFKNDQPLLANPLTGGENRCFPRIQLLHVFHVYECQATLSSPPSSPGCVLVVYDEHSIQYCSPGDEGWWEVQGLEGEAGHHVQSVVVVGGKGYVWFHDQGLASFVLTSTHDPTLTIMDAHAPLPRGVRHLRPFFSLAESRGELLALSAIREPHLSHFIVFRFDASSCKWVMSQDLGGRAAFAGWWGNALVVDNHAKWGGSCEDHIHFWEPRLNKPLKYLTSDRLPLLRLSLKDVGLWVRPSLLPSTSL